MRITCLLAGLPLALLSAASPWPGEDLASAVDLTPLDAEMQLEMSAAHFNSQTQTLWVSAAGGGAKGIWALRYDAGIDGFALAAKWNGPRDEGLTQVDLAPLDRASTRHRVYVLKEGGDGGGDAQILEVTYTYGATPTADGATSTSRTWTIPEAETIGDGAGAEGLAFVPDADLARLGAVDGAGAALASTGGMGGIFFIAHQHRGLIYAVDCATAAVGAVFPGGRTHLVRGIYATTGVSASGLEYDRSIGRLYIHHDNRTIQVTDVTSLEVSDAVATRRLRTLVLFDEPTPSNTEGFAVAPFLAPEGGRNPRRWAFSCIDFEAGSSNQSVRWFRAFTPESGVPSLPVVLAGDGQSAPPGMTLPIVPRVLVRDDRGYPLLGVTVTFVLGHGGSIAQTTTVTDDQGQATCGPWTLGPTRGTQSLTAVVGGLAVGLSATATAGPERRIRIQVPQAGAAQLSSLVRVNGGDWLDLGADTTTADMTGLAIEDDHLLEFADAPNAAQ